MLVEHPLIAILTIVILGKTDDDDGGNEAKPTGITYEKNVSKFQPLSNSPTGHVTLGIPNHGCHSGGSDSRRQTRFCRQAAKNRHEGVVVFGPQSR